ncbi:hypothetical protein NUW54_g14031 [Trametes sanguinea]|uniref:Uncharacterized protein n=1 Tax=Trametes sanguinea TaxID=158606 RepID=A0ACC1MFI9_9APHY|nr:hypothetical protein NUW54_g14031 [Trametes sanguinea]
MRRAGIFQGVLVAIIILFVYLVEGKQTRRARDEAQREELGQPAVLEELPAGARASPGAEKGGGGDVQVREVRDRSEERPLERVEEDDVGEGGRHPRHHDHRPTVRRPRAVYYDREPVGRPDEAVELGAVS